QRTAFRMEVKALLPDDKMERDLSWLDDTAPMAFSADGKSLLFYESGEGGGSGYSVYLRGVDGSPPVRLGDGRAMGLSPAGQRALSIPLHAPSRLVLLPTGAGEPRVIQNEGFDYERAAFLPDGRHAIVAASERGRPSRLYEQDLAGGRPRPIAPEGAFE